MSGSDGWIGGVKDAADELAAGDEVEDVEDDMKAVRSLIERTNQLLAANVGAEGTVELPENVISTPHKYSVIPPTNDKTRLAVPAGTTTINFSDGYVKDPNGEIVVDDDELITISDMSRGLDEIRASLRSVFALADVPIQMSIDGGPWHEIDSCNYYPIPATSFEEIRLTAGVPYSFELKASTRSDPFDVSGVAVHATRDGETAAGAHDAYTPMVWQPEGLTDRNGDFSEAKGGVHAISFSRNTFVIENTSGNGNPIDVQLLGKQLHGGEFREIDEVMGVSDGDHTIIDVSQTWHAFLVKIKNQTGGATVSAEGEYAGRAP